MLFSPTCEVLLKITDKGNSSQKVEAEFAYEILISFKFVFILHFVNETMGITDKQIGRASCRERVLMSV